jgi:hypothetical protein
MARKAFTPSQEQRNLVTVLSSYGIRQEDIATEVGLRSPKTLRKYFRRELDHGRIGSDFKVRKTFYQMAESGKYPHITVRWIEQRRGSRPQAAEEIRSAAIPDFVVAREKEAA